MGTEQKEEQIWRPCFTLLAVFDERLSPKRRTFTLSCQLSWSSNPLILFYLLVPESCDEVDLVVWYMNNFTQRPYRYEWRRLVIFSITRVIYVTLSNLVTKEVDSQSPEDSFRNMSVYVSHMLVLNTTLKEKKNKKKFKYFKILSDWKNFQLSFT